MKILISSNVIRHVYHIKILLSRIVVSIWMKTNKKMHRKYIKRSMTWFFLSNNTCIIWFLCFIVTVCRKINLNAQASDQILWSIWVQGLKEEMIFLNFNFNFTKKKYYSFSMFQKWKEKENCWNFGRLM